MQVAACKLDFLWVRHASSLSQLDCLAVGCACQCYCTHIDLCNTQETERLQGVMKMLLQKLYEATQYAPLQRQLLATSVHLLHALQILADAVPVKVC